MANSISSDSNPFRDRQFIKFSAYGFLKNLRFFEAFLILAFREAGLSYFQIGILYSVREVCKNLLEIPSGIVADSYGRKNALVFSFAAYLGSFVIFFLASQFVLFIVGMLFFGMGEAFRSGTHKAMILHYLKLNNLLAYKTRYYGRTRSWSQMGSALSSLISIIIIFAARSYRWLFLISMIPAALDLINILSYPSYLNSSPGGRKEQPDWREVGREYLKQFSGRKQWRIYFSAAAYGGFYKTMKDYLQPLLKNLALQLPIFVFLGAEKRTALVVGLTYFLIYLLTSYSSRRAYRLEERFKDLARAVDYSFFIGVFGCLLSGLAIALHRTLPAVMIFIAVYLVQNIRRPLVISYMGEMISAKIMASGLSTVSQLETILIIVASPLLGAIIDRVGLGPGLMLVSLLFMVVYRMAGMMPSPTHTPSKIKD